VINELKIDDLTDGALVDRVRVGLAEAEAWPDAVFDDLSRFDYRSSTGIIAEPIGAEDQARAFAAAVVELARRVDTIEPGPRERLLDLIWRPASPIAKKLRPFLLRTRPELEKMRARHLNLRAAERARERAKKHKVVRIAVECLASDAEAVRAFVRELNKKSGIAETMLPGKVGRPRKTPAPAPSDVQPTIEDPVQTASPAAVPAPAPRDAPVEDSLQKYRRQERELQMFVSDPPVRK
jgi:hypothetical protein